MTLELISKRDPEVIKSLYRYRKEVFKEGSLTTREKELMAMAVASVLKCEKCYEYHAEAAIKAGATGQDILETTEVVMYMSGPSASVWSEKVDEFAKIN